MPTSSHPSHNAFTEEFLRRLDEIGEPDGTHEADVAGPWVVRHSPTMAAVPTPGTAATAAGSSDDRASRHRRSEDFAVLREWERPEEGDEPYATFTTRELALLAAAILPATGREPLFRLGTEPDETGFPLLAQAPAAGAGGPPGAAIAGHLRDFDEDLAAGLNFVAALVRSPRSLARVLEAAGHVTLAQAGRALEQSIRERREPTGGSPP